MKTMHSAIRTLAGLLTAFEEGHAVVISRQQALNLEEALGALADLQRLSDWISADGPAEPSGLSFRVWDTGRGGFVCELQNGRGDTTKLDSTDNVTPWEALRAGAAHLRLNPTLRGAERT